MDAQRVREHYRTLTDAEHYVALSLGAALLFLGVTRRAPYGACLAVAAVPLLYRGLTGRWPAPLPRLRQSGDTRLELGGPKGVHVRESIRLEVPIGEVYRFWRQLSNLPRFMSHLQGVTETGDRTSHWVAAGPAGMSIEWDAEIINDMENDVVAWRSLPGSEVASAGSVSFKEVRGGRSTEVAVHLQYAPPAGKAGVALAALFGREPSQTIREDLRHLKQWLEAGEIARVRADQQES